MRKRWKIAIFGIIAALAAGMLATSLFIYSIGIHDLKLIYTLHTTNKTIILIESTAAGHGSYLTRAKHSTEAIKARMSQEGWMYVRQDGSGYFFEKGSQRAIVTTIIWHHNYVKIQVQNNVVDLADKAEFET